MKRCADCRMVISIVNDAGICGYCVAARRKAGGA